MNNNTEGESYFDTPSFPYAVSVNATNSDATHSIEMQLQRQLEESQQDTRNVRLQLQVLKLQNELDESKKKHGKELEDLKKKHKEELEDWKKKMEGTRESVKHWATTSSAHLIELVETKKMRTLHDRAGKSDPTLESWFQRNPGSIDSEDDSEYDSESDCEPKPDQKRKPNPKLKPNSMSRSVSMSD